MSKTKTKWPSHNLQFIKKLTKHKSKGTQTSYTTCSLTQICTKIPNSNSYHDCNKFIPVKVAEEACRSTVEGRHRRER